MSGGQGPTWRFRLRRYQICPERCRRCGLCIEACPRDGAIMVPEHGPFAIDPDSCDSCGACYEACKLHSVVKRLRLLPGRTEKTTRK
ncbi:MAG: 4Fe-4S binding protein [Coriobacteriales bacterium]|nr:4Fe-4S binding protein [Coriobacteriales bacterium]